MVPVGQIVKTVVRIEQVGGGVDVTRAEVLEPVPDGDVSVPPVASADGALDGDVEDSEPNALDAAAVESPLVPLLAPDAEVGGLEGAAEDAPTVLEALLEAERYEDEVLGAAEVVPDEEE